MQYKRFDEAQVENPSPGWFRAGLASMENVSVDWFEKPPGHISKKHSHENIQVFVVLEGVFILHTENESVTLHAMDVAWVDPWEEHWSENPGDKPTRGLNIFTPGRAFPYWAK